MRVWGGVLRVVLLVGVFAGVGLWSAHLVMAREMAHGQPEYAVRLASYMTGLFAGGVLATLVGIAMLLLRRRPAQEGPS